MWTGNAGAGVFDDVRSGWIQFFFFLFFFFFTKWELQLRGVGALTGANWSVQMTPSLSSRYEPSTTHALMKFFVPIQWPMFFIFSSWLFSVQSTYSHRHHCAPAVAKSHLSLSVTRICSQPTATPSPLNYGPSCRYILSRTSSLHASPVYLSNSTGSTALT